MIDPERYFPTSAEKKTFKHQPETLLLSSDGDRGLFVTLQGEGPTAGAPAIFVRLQGCNLRCSFCDTPYTVYPERRDFWQGVTRENYSNLANRIKDSWRRTSWESLSQLPGYQNLGPRLVMTGGEPLRQKAAMSLLLTLLPEFSIEVETNGTISPRPELDACQINCSPKLENSGNRLQSRYRKGILADIARMKNSVFKFVAKEQSDFAEIDEIVSGCQIERSRVLIMPEGVDRETLVARASVLLPGIQERGYKLGQRLHVTWFENKRGA